MEVPSPSVSAPGRAAGGSLDVAVTGTLQEAHGAKTTLHCVPYWHGPSLIQDARNAIHSSEGSHQFLAGSSSKQLVNWSSALWTDCLGTHQTVGPTCHGSLIKLFE